MLCNTLHTFLADVFISVKVAVGGVIVVIVVVV